LEDNEAEYPVRIDPTFSDANWLGLGGVPGVDGWVLSEVLDAAGNLYVGGSFTVAGSVMANNIAKWNGSSWSALGSGITGAGFDGAGPYVSALAVSGATLYVGGDFTKAGGVSATNIAQWNGSSWSAVGSGISGLGYDGYSYVSALLVSGGILYAGGDFTKAGGGAVGYIAKWNGSAWSGLGVGMNDAVYALAVSGSTLYAGGYFDMAGSVWATNIAQWNGSAWSAVGSGMSGAGVDGYGPYVSALAVSGSTLYAGGDFTKAGSVSANYIAKWNGSAWSALGSGISGSGNDGGGPVVYALAMLGTNLYAGGEFSSAGGLSASSIAKWNGSSWSAMGSGMSVGNSYASYVYALTSGTNLYAGGIFTMAGGAPTDGVAVWDGNSFSNLGAGMNSLVWALAMSGNTLFAGGDFITAPNGAWAYGIAQWNGSTWSGLGSGMDNDVYALAVSGNTLYAGGNFTWAGATRANGIARWNGTVWSALGSGMSGAGIDGNGPYVLALAVSDTNLYAGGDFTMAGGVPATNIARWNGSSWSALGTGISGVGANTYGPYVSALAVGTNLYAGGNFTRAGGVSATNIAQWNGSSWSSLGTGTSGANGNVNGPFVSSLAMLSNNLYVGGNFAKAGGTSAANIARWSGSSWSALGSGISGSGDGYGPYVSALAVSGTNLYVGGDFSTAGSVSASGIAQWNGSSWSALGSGIAGGYGGPQVYALAISNSILYAGGWFAMAGTNVSAYLAEAVVGSTPPFIITTNSNFGFTNGLTQFGFDVLALGDLGQKLVIDASTNLSNWAPVQTNVLSSSLYHFIDKYPTNFTLRFYRAKVSP
jgi:trimeric autotransporter adhesin